MDMMHESLLKINAATPMMQQYLSIKAGYPDILVFYRMGDFYELFFDDAIKAAPILDIALTKRGKHIEQDIPMCGVPAHSYEPYLEKLIKSGFKVAICEQLETPEQAKKRGNKSVVRREIIRIATPGTIIEDSLLNAMEANYLASITEIANKLAISWADISTGEFLVSSTSPGTLLSDLSRINPKEILIADKLYARQDIAPSLDNWKNNITTYAPSFFEKARTERKIQGFYQLSSLEILGDLDQSAISACGAMLEYIEMTQKSSLPRMRLPKFFYTQHVMTIDAATRNNLELVRTLSGQYQGSLLSVIRKTVSNSGSRLLINYLSAPLINKEAINARLDMIQFFIEQSDIRGRLREILFSTPDIERSLSRICMFKGALRDLISIRTGLEKIEATSYALESIKSEVPQSLVPHIQGLYNHDQLYIKLKEALKDEVGIWVEDGNFIKNGYDPQLDKLRYTHENCEGLKEELREKYRKETNINNLKISENNIIGFYIEVTSLHSSKVPDYFIHRQTLSGIVRYTTRELKELEANIVNAKELALKREIEIFNELVKDIISEADKITLSVQSLAAFDVFTSLAELAFLNNYVRPQITEDFVFVIKDGRHPVVEAYTAKNNFIPNDTNIDDKERVWLITGPNMAGKSTFLRQNALIAILAQMGSYVPAGEAHIGIVDRIFSRVGAADDLARGQSTFMVEMLETATILHNATPKSLVILDEIGRGTATFDGLSIAWAVLEYLCNVNKCRAFFATHYHELTSLSKDLEAISCHTMKVKEWQGDIVFLHEVEKGTADKSYGIHVAKLAGIPKPVIERAKEILATLERGDHGKSLAKLANDLPLFIANNKEPNDNLRETLKNINPDQLSPKEALDLIYKLKEL